MLTAAVTVGSSQDSASTIAIEALGTAQALPRAAPSAASQDRLVGRSLTRDAEIGGFFRFEWVSSSFLQAGDRLARSSAPHYHKTDHDQRLTAESMSFLKQQGITHVISLNSEANNAAIRATLAKNGIAYTAVPVGDYKSPTLDDLKRGYRAFDAHRSGTLVWCGYGHGRTGTMVTALQVYSEQARPQRRLMLQADYSRNHVETAGQTRLLDRLQRSLRPGALQLAAASVVTKVGSAWDKAVGNKALDVAVPAAKPKPKPGPKLVVDAWAGPAASKPVKGVPKKFGGVSLVGAGPVKPGLKVPSTLKPAPPLAGKKNLLPATKNPGTMFFAGRARPGIFVGGGRFGGGRMPGGFLGAPGM